MEPITYHNFISTSLVCINVTKNTYHSCSNGKSLVTAVADTPSDYNCGYKSGNVAKISIHSYISLLHLYLAGSFLLNEDNLMT